MKIAWVTVNYHQDEYLAEWTASVSGLNPGGTKELYVVDNSGTLGRGALDGRATVLKSAKNLGYFGGFNHFLERVEVDHYDLMVFSNPDIVFSPDFLQQLLQTTEEQSTPMVIAPRITTTSGIEQNPNADSKISRVNKLYYALLFSSYPAFALLSRLRAAMKRPRQPVDADMMRRAIYMSHGACFIISREFFLHYGRLDDRVFLWGEEALLRKQVHDAGGEIWFWPNLHVTHCEHTSTDKMPTRKKFELMRQSYKVYRKCL